MSERILAAIRRDTILILKNQQATSTTAISWKSEHPKIDTLNKFV